MQPARFQPGPKHDMEAPPEHGTTWLAIVPVPARSTEQAVLGPRARHGGWHGPARKLEKARWQPVTMWPANSPQLFPNPKLRTYSARNALLPLHSRSRDGAASDTRRLLPSRTRRRALSPRVALPPPRSAQQPYRLLAPRSRLLLRSARPSCSPLHTQLSRWPPRLLPAAVDEHNNGDIEHDNGDIERNLASPSPPSVDACGPRISPVPIWALCSSGWNGPKYGPRVVPGPEARHGVLGRHGPVARWVDRARALPGRALHGPVPCRVGPTRCSSLTMCCILEDINRPIVEKVFIIGFIC